MKQNDNSKNEKEKILDLCLNEPCLASISCYIEPTLTTQYQQKPAAEISQNFFSLNIF